MSSQSSYTRDNIFKRSAPRGFDFVHPQFRSPQQLPRALSPQAFLNNRMASPVTSKNECISSTSSSYQWRFDKEKANGVQHQQQTRGIFVSGDVSMESLQKRLETFFAATRNFIYSATKMKADMSAVISDYDQQIDFSVKLFEADKLSLEKSLGKVESQLFSLKDLGEKISGDYGSTSSKSPVGGFRSPQRDKSNLLQQQQSQDDIFGSSLQYDRIRLENRELKLQVAKLRNEIESISLRKQDSNANAVNELETLKKQVGKIERKANERKVCIKRLYSLLELKDKDLENLKGFKSTYPIPALTNFIAALNSHDTSHKLQNYLDMSAKEAKLKKMLSREDSALTGSKKIEIEDMIEFLKAEQQDVISHFAALVSTQPVIRSPRLQPARPNISQNGSVLLGSPSLQQDGNTSRIQANSSKSMPRSRDSSQHFSPTNVPRMRSHEPYKQQQQLQQQFQQNSQKNQEELDWVLKEQVDYIKRKYLGQFESMLAELVFPETPLRLPEDQLIARVRDEFSSQLKKTSSLIELVEEQRRALGSREDALIVTQAEIENLQQEIMRKEEQLVANNPRLMQLEEEVSQLNDQRNAAEQELVEMGMREKAYQEEIDNLKEELFMVLDNLKISMETAGLIDQQEEKNVEDMLNALRSYLETQQQMVHLHSDVYSDMERRLMQFSGEIENLNEERTSLLEEIQRSEENNQRLQEENQYLGAREQDKRHPLEEKIYELENEIHVIKQNGLAPETAEQLKNELEQKQAALEYAQEDLENLKQQIHTLNQQQQKDLRMDYLFYYFELTNYGHQMG